MFDWVQNTSLICPRVLESTEIKGKGFYKHFPKHFKVSLNNLDPTVFVKLGMGMNWLTQISPISSSIPPENTKKTNIF